MVKVLGESHNNWLDSIAKKQPENPLVEPIKLFGKDKCETLSGLDKCFDTGPYKPKPGNLDRVLNIKMHETDTKKIIDENRNTFSHSSHYWGLRSFQSSVDEMNKTELDTSQKYLLDLISDPTNNDDQYLFYMLKTVNERIDSGYLPVPENQKIKPWTPDQGFD